MNEAVIKQISDISISPDVIKMSYIKSFVKEVSRTLNYYQKGSLVILSGKTGTGKSTFLAEEVAMFLDQSLKVASFSGELSDMKFKFWLYKILAGGNNLEYQVDTYLEKKIGYVPKSIEKQIDEYYHNKLFLLDYNHGLADEDDLIDKFLYLNETKGVNVFTIDNQMMIELGDTDDKWEKRANTIQKFVSLAEVTNGIVILVVHPRKVVDKMTLADIAGQQDITAKSSVVMIQHRVQNDIKSKPTIGGEENPLYNVDAVLEIAKNRDAGELANIRLKHCKTSSRMYALNEPEKKDYKFAWEAKKDFVI